MKHLWILLFFAGCASQVPQKPTEILPPEVQVLSKVFNNDAIIQTVLPPQGKTVDFDYGSIPRSQYNWTLWASQDLQHWWIYPMRTNDFDAQGYLSVTTQPPPSYLFFKMEGKLKTLN